MRILTAGESHGPGEVVIIEGMPAGVPVRIDKINHDLQLRRTDFGRSARGKIEKDEVEIIAGIRHGKTLGSPIALMVKNTDFKNWADEMSVAEASANTTKLTRPRAGHADLPGVLKYGQDDIRNVSERASARETVMRVAAGAVLRQLLREFNIRIASHTIQIGPVKITRYDYDFEDVASVFEKDPAIRCIEPEISRKMKNLIIEAQQNKDTLGGIVEIIADGVPVGLGSMMHYDRRLDGHIAQALMSIPAVKAVEIGNGIAGAAMSGSQFQDRIRYRDNRFVRESNNAGGIEGGISNGEPIVCRVYQKPLPTLGAPLQTVDIATHRLASGISERSDICAVPRLGIVSEAMLAIVIATAMTDKFGSDSLKEMRRNYLAYTKEAGCVTG